MKVYISSDIEGCVGVTTWCETENGQEDYESACSQMTLETAAACEAAMEMGFTPWILIKQGGGFNSPPFNLTLAIAEDYYQQ